MSKRRSRPMDKMFFSQRKRQDSVKAQAEHRCINCDEVLKAGAGHFAPPCFGDEGFFICKRKDSNYDSSKNNSKDFVGDVPASQSVAEDGQPE